MLTDNKNRTVGEIRHILTKHGGNLAETNAVAWMFTKRGYIVVPKSKADEDDADGRRASTPAATICATTRTTGKCCRRPRHFRRCSRP